MDSEERRSVVTQVLQASNLSECDLAEARLTQWLKDNPRDWTMYELVGTLSTLKIAARERAQSVPARASA